jgi:iron complex transport system substrate-binding protein
MEPERIVCLGAELPAIFYHLGALDRVVGISAYTDWPPEALTIPKVSGFRYGHAKRILAVRPDLVILTSTVQEPLAAQLAGHGVPLLHLYPHRLDDLFRSVRLLGNLVQAGERAESLVQSWTTRIREIERAAKTLPRRPRVYFEEWMDPLVAGIGWVSDLITMAGGQDIFAERAQAGYRADARTVHPDEVVQRAPDLMLVSWCGKPMNKAEIFNRPGWDAIPAIRHDAVIECGDAILQCGPRLIDDVLPWLYATFRRWTQDERGVLA